MTRIRVVQVSFVILNEVKDLRFRRSPWKAEWFKYKSGSKRQIPPQERKARIAG
jgi:hypothetical protein